jgi:drug/metabolite transporter (DMT)-like permease
MKARVAGTGHDHLGRGIALRFVSAAAFACLAALVKLAGNRGFPLLEIVFFRSAFGLVLVAGYIALRRDFAKFGTKRLKAHLFRSAVGGTGMLFVFLGIVSLPLNEATAIGFSVPLVATLMSALFLKERVGPHRWLATIVGFAGVLLIVHPEPGRMIAEGAIYALIGVGFSAAVAVTIRQITATEPGETVAFYFMLLSALAMAAAQPFVWITPATTGDWAILIATGFVGGLVQLTMSISLRHGPVSALVPFDYSQLVWAGLIAWAVWDELPGVDTLAGALIIAGSGLYIIYREWKVASRPLRMASTIDEG